MENFINAYIIVYPVFMSMLWSFGALVHYFKNEREFHLTNKEKPFVSILVPCYNEAENVEEIIYRLSNLNYEHYEIIAIDDGSTDATAQLLSLIAENNSQVRFVRSKQNRGKANALYLGLLAAKAEYLVCVDADAYLDANALNYMIPYFLTENNGQDIAAVTGNPQVRNRNSLLSKIQVAEFSSIVGSIKRTQQLGDLVMTVSGVIVTFRKQALLDVNLWDRDMITEDIAVTWKFHQKDWKIKYEPRAICWMLVPEQLSGLWHQRVRWAEGGVEVLFRHFQSAMKNGKFPVILLIEQICGIVWSYLWVINFIMYIGFGTNVQSNAFQSYFLEVTCLIQFSIAIFISARYDRTIIKEIIWVIWYPLVYWYFNALCIAYAFLKTVTKPKTSFAKWNSPDRGNPSDDDVDLDLSIEERVDLNTHIKKTYQSRFFFIFELILTCLLWFLFFSSSYHLINYFWFNHHILNIGFFTTAFSSSYAVYFIGYIIAMIFAVILLVIYYISSKLIQHRSRVEHQDELAIINNFNISINEARAIARQKIQTIDNNQIDLYQKERTDAT